MRFDRPASPSLFSRSPRVRWIAVLSASALLHALVFGWAGGQLAFPVRGQAQPPVVTAVLQPPPAPPRPPPKPKSVPKPKRQAPPKPTPLPAPQPDTAASPPAATSTAAPAPPTDAADEAVPETPSLADLMPDLEQPQVAPRLLWQAVDLPPPAELHYDVFALKKEQRWYGNGVFRWESNGGRYSLAGEANASLLFFNLTVLNFSSEGVINEFGVAPLQYTEKTRGKTGTSTRFSHEQGRILFSASNTSHPYHGGEQDRASVVWQLAGIGRAAPERFQPGAELEVVVAGPRDADLWHIRVIGMDEIEAAGGTLRAWHLARVRQRESGDQRLDFWLAPERDWYPVKIRQSDANGDYLELTLDELKTAAAAQPS